MMLTRVSAGFDDSRHFAGLGPFKDSGLYQMGGTPCPFSFPHSSLVFSSSASVTP